MGTRCNFPRTLSTSPTVAIAVRIHLAPLQVLSPADPDRASDEAMLVSIGRAPRLPATVGVIDRRSGRSALKSRKRPPGERFRPPIRSGPLPPSTGTAPGFTSPTDAFRIVRRRHRGRRGSNRPGWKARRVAIAGRCRARRFASRAGASTRAGRDGGRRPGRSPRARCPAPRHATRVCGPAHRVQEKIFRPGTSTGVVSSVEKS